ncbi:MAG: PepSY domain-containing protein [Acidobacteriota bacterium]
MKTRTLHRFIGLIMLLPFIGWAITGAIFFLKPGYAGAYELLQVKTYPLESQTVIKPQNDWLEARLVKTILGEHLLVRTAQGARHLDPQTLAPRNEPTEDEIQKLLSDALQINPSRYGHINKIEGKQITTDTGVRVTLNWERLTLTQRGADTDRIDWFYKIHYLQWTGIALLDKTLGAVGIALVVILSLLGLRLFFRRG